MNQNPGFIIEINNQRFGNKFTLGKSLKKLPKEYGPKIISHSNDFGEWFYFLPDNQDELMVKLFYDDGENFILFYGSLYNHKPLRSANEIKKQLINILNENSIEKLKKFINSLSGYFCGIIGNNYKNIVLAFTDKFGIAKLFYLIKKNKKVFSTNLFLLKEYYLENASFSDLAGASILYTGHTFNQQTIIKDVLQIQPGNIARFNFRTIYNENINYQIFPERKNIKLKETVEVISNAHKNFTKRIGIEIEDNLTLLLSRGKDCRVTLKYLLDLQYAHTVLTYYRENNPIYPFVSFLTDSKDDAAVAEKVCSFNRLPHEKIKIDNNAFLKNINDVLILNHGAPSHWEIFEASKEASRSGLYLISGFAGDLFAGKNKHRYVLGKIRDRNEFGRLTFLNQTSDIQSFSKVSTILNRNGITNFPSSEELLNSWVNQYSSIKSDDLDVIGAIGWVRTRGLGRIVPTFHQARLYTSPIYPYIDNEIIDAYFSIPSKYLAGEKAHLMQLSGDNRFNQFPTTRFSLNAKSELKFLKIISLLRKIDYLKSKYLKARNLKMERSIIYNYSLRKTLLESNFFNLKIIDELLPEKSSNPLKYYQIIANLISLIRINEVFFLRNHEQRNDLKVIPYQTKRKREYILFNS